jgi:hypothetical protein
MESCGRCIPALPRKTAEDQRRKDAQLLRGDVHGTPHVSVNPDGKVLRIRASSSERRDGCGMMTFGEAHRPGHLHWQMVHKYMAFLDAQGMSLK